MVHRLRLLLVSASLAFGLAAPTLGVIHAKAAVVPWGTVLVPGAVWAGAYAALGDVNVYSNGTGSQDQWDQYGPTYECTELAVRWAAIRYGVNPHSWQAGDAWSFFDAAPRLSVPFEALPNGGSAPPAFGDILVFDKTSFDPSGHVAVVSGTGPGYVDIVEQNWANQSPTGFARLPISGTTMPLRWGLPIRGWLRASSAPFVGQAYRDVLGRPVDSAGLSYWSGALDKGLARTSFALTMQSSVEARALFVSSEYKRLLRRDVDPAGKAYWSGYLATHTVQQFEATIMGPPEYFITQGGGTAAGFVTALYTDTLGRTPDAAGQAYFMAMVAKGVSHEAIANAMVWTPEGLSHRVAIMYLTYLHRTGDSAGIAHFADFLLHGTSVQQLAALFMASDEYQAYANAHYVA